MSDKKSFKELKPGDKFKFFKSSSICVRLYGDTYADLEDGAIYGSHDNADVEVYVPKPETDILKILSNQVENQEKQVIYDAVYHYMFAQSEMASSNHFAKDLFKKDTDICTDLVKRIRNEWKWEIIP